MLPQPTPTGALLRAAQNRSPHSNGASTPNICSQHMCPPDSVEWGPGGLFSYTWRWVFTETNLGKITLSTSFVQFILKRAALSPVGRMAFSGPCVFSQPEHLLYGNRGQ